MQATVRAAYGERAAHAKSAAHVKRTAHARRTVHARRKAHARRTLKAKRAAHSMCAIHATCAAHTTAHMVQAMARVAKLRRAWRTLQHARCKLRFARRKVSAHGQRAAHAKRTPHARRTMHARRKAHARRMMHAKRAAHSMCAVHATCAVHTTANAIVSVAQATARVAKPRCAWRTRQHARCKLRFARRTGRRILAGTFSGAEIYFVLNIDILHQNFIMETHEKD